MLNLQQQQIETALLGTGITISRERMSVIYRARLEEDCYEIYLKMQLRRQFGQRIHILQSGTEPNPDNPRLARAVWVTFTYK